MSKLVERLQQRFLKRETPPPPAEREPSSLVAHFLSHRELDEKDKSRLLELLHKFSPEDATPIPQDFTSLMHITSEVKAINNQAAILHGERIKRAQTILKKYREGAFTAWLLAAYGNRQTPYNFLQYYEFYSKMPEELRKQMEGMPRQIVYTLASRQGSMEQKETVVRSYQGEPTEQVLARIRSLFPLDAHDQRKENEGEAAIKMLQRAATQVLRAHTKMTPEQKALVGELMDTVRTHLHNPH